MIRQGTKSPAAERKLVKMVKTQQTAGRQVSVSTVTGVFYQRGLKDCRARKKRVLQTQHPKTQPNFAADHKDKDKTSWRKTLWSYERESACTTCASPLT